MPSALPCAATAQGIYAAVVGGIVMGSVTVAAGPLYRNFGGEAYAAMALIALIGTAAAILLMRRWQGGLIAGSDAS